MSSLLKQFQIKIGDNPENNIKHVCSFNSTLHFSHQAKKTTWKFKEQYVYLITTHCYSGK